MPDSLEPTDATTGAAPLAGRVVAITAERRRDDQAELFRKRGAEVVLAQTVHTVDLSQDHELRRATDDVIDSPPDWTIATTGFGMRLWFDVAESWGVLDELLAALDRTRIVARGPKARSACRQRGLDVEWTAAGESMDEVVDWVTAQPGFDAQDALVQLFDPADHPTTTAIARRCHRLVTIPLYRWELPADVAPIVDLVHRIAEGDVDAVTFTSQPAVRFLLKVAAERGVADDVVAAFNRRDVLALCIGPVCVEALVEAGVDAAAYPEPYRLAPMVRLGVDLLTNP